jgi:hypothetical protein
MNIFSTGMKYRTCPVGIPDLSGMHVFCRTAYHSDQYQTCLVFISDVSGIQGFSGIALNLLLLISNFKSNCKYLLDMTIYTNNLYKSKSNTNIEWNANWGTIFVLPKFRLVRVLLFIERAAVDPTKVSPRGYHEGHSSWSLFQLLFLLPLVDSEAAESTVTNFLRHTTISRVLSSDA